jgi:hypothetical protein
MSSIGNDKFKTRFEFVLKLNKDIIVQRFFNVRKFNEKAAKSLSMKDTTDQVVSIIKKGIMKKSIDHLWNNYDPYGFYYDDDGDIVIKDIPKYNLNDIKDNFTFTVKVDGKPISETMFSGYGLCIPVFFENGQKIRYIVDIKDSISTIISKLQIVLQNTEETE